MSDDPLSLLREWVEYSPYYDIWDDTKLGRCVRCTWCDVGWQSHAEAEQSMRDTTKPQHLAGCIWLRTYRHVNALEVVVPEAEQDEN